MKYLIAIIVFVFLTSELIAQINCKFSDSLNLYLKNGRPCNCEENYFDSLSLTHVFNKFNNGVKVKSKTTDVLGTNIREEQIEGMQHVINEYYSSGKIQLNIIETERSYKKFYWDDNGLLSEFEKINDGKVYRESYNIAFMLINIFECDLNKNNDCYQRKYNYEGKMLDEMIFRPLQFTKLNEEQRQLIRSKLSLNGVYIKGPCSDYDENGRLTGKSYFKNGVIYKHEEYLLSGKKKITKFDEKGNRIEEMNK